MKEINGYEAPVVEIIEVEVEKGFVISDGEGTTQTGQGGSSNF